MYVNIVICEAYIGGSLNKFFFLMQMDGLSFKEDCALHRLFLKEVGDVVVKL